METVLIVTLSCYFCSAAGDGDTFVGAAKAIA
jgi:hypothetical protein